MLALLEGDTGYQAVNCLSKINRYLPRRWLFLLGYLIRSKLSYYGVEILWTDEVGHFGVAGSGNAMPSASASGTTIKKAPSSCLQRKRQICCKDAGPASMRAGGFGRGKVGASLPWRGLLCSLQDLLNSRLREKKLLPALCFFGFAKFSSSGNSSFLKREREREKFNCDLWRHQSQQLLWHWCS